MSIWKIISGIISILLCFFVIFQSCAAGIFNALSQNGQSSGTAGLLVAVLILAGGIVSIATRDALSSIGNVAIILIYGLAAALGYLMAGSYTDLVVWATWCVVCAVMAACAIAADNICDWWVFALIVLAGVIIIAAGFVMNLHEDTDSPSRPASRQTQPEDNQEPPEYQSQNEPENNSSQTGAGSLGDYYVEIKNAVVSEDSEGNPAIIITYAWTNNSENTTNAEISIMEKAFQDGVQLDSAFIGDSSVYDSGLGFKDVRPGTTIDVQAAYALTSEASPVEFELTEFLSFSDETVMKTFDIEG